MKRLSVRRGFRLPRRRARFSAHYDRPARSLARCAQTRDRPPRGRRLRRALAALATQRAYTRLRSRPRRRVWKP